MTLWGWWLDDRGLCISGVQDSIIEKLRLKNAALKGNLKKVQGQLQQKVRGVDGCVDVSVMRWDVMGCCSKSQGMCCITLTSTSCKSRTSRCGCVSQATCACAEVYELCAAVYLQLAAKVEERNDELLKLKITTGRTVQILNQLKVR